METSQILIMILAYILIFFISSFILWRISKRQKLKKQNFGTALLIIGISVVVSILLSFPSYFNIIFPIIVRILIGILITFLTIILIKKFYQVDWWKSIKIYLLMILITFLIAFIIGFLIGLLSFMRVWLLR